MLSGMNARFWVWINDSPVKLTMIPGQAFSWFRRCPTEEGWSSELHTYEFDGSAVSRVLVYDGRDCDGRLTRSYRDVASVDSLMMINVDCIYYPLWEDGTSEVYDEYAQAANY